MTYVLAGIDAPTRATATNTMRKMALDVRQAIVLPTVWETARQIAATVRDRDEVAQALAIRAWVRAHMRFVKDPVDHQLLTVPEYMLDAINTQGYVQGDCADAAELTAALCMAIGIHATFVAVAFNSPTANYSHVFTIADAKLPGGGVGKVEMDVTRPDAVKQAKFSRYLRLSI